MRFGNQVGRRVVALACMAVLPAGGLGARAQDWPAPEPPPQPPEVRGPDSGTLREETARNLIWDRVAQERLQADRQKLEADMRRLEGERQRLDAELRRATEALRRTQEEGGRIRQERDRGRDRAKELANRAREEAREQANRAREQARQHAREPAREQARRGPAGQPGQPPQPRQPGQPMMPGSDWERELMRAHGLGAETSGPGWVNAAFLGVSASAAPDELRQRLQLPAGIGLVVGSVEPRSPAERAGLKPHDLLHKLNDQLLVNVEQLTVLVRTFKPGQEVKLTILRGGRSTELSARLGERNLAPLNRPGPSGLAPPMVTP